MVKKRMFFDIEVEKSDSDNFAYLCRRKDITMKDRVKELVELDVVDYLNEEPNEKRENELNDEVLSDEFDFEAKSKS